MGIFFFSYLKTAQNLHVLQTFKISAPSAITPTNKLYVKIYNRSKSLAAVNVKVW